MNYGFGNLTKRASGTHSVSKVSVNADDMASRPDHLFKVSVVAVCCWILIEAPLELSGSIDSTSLLAVMASKVLICLIGVGAIVDLRWTRHVFAFICASSVFAVAPALPLEYAHSVALGLVSTVECLAKATCVVAFAMASRDGDSVGERLSEGRRTASDQK
ncbi:hypothetical protein M3I53_36220 [Paraburkholderia sp. CNPSo 3272]|uniref:hypothetical protein n=1 Tax=Paraburkholderia sp. CNPSo 3272 TaxID=2940931 RepID=UPI0020B72B57|nr:hypothetical protein [Paraburkholderia sp. CNPSo 3272]MCP3728492.1 hypothetical protein [Paraburkholderia sp. CNPSo 3272]